MKKSLLLLTLLACSCVKVFSQGVIKREMRGTWIATYANIDWPKNRTEPVPLQRAALIAILDHHQATGINTIYFQIRSQCDAMYESTIEPWSADLTGTQGKAPMELSLTDPSGQKLWDPLKFIIQECHKRGMELHAWMNPYRAINNYNGINSFAPTHVARQHPEWLLSQGTLRILDPGIPAAQAYIKKVVADVASRYDVDGIHFDDYFYPPQAPVGVTPYNDDATFNADPRGFTDRGDWRRDNVNRFIKAISDTLKVIKPWIEFGVSPSGIYRNSTNPAIGSPTSGLQHYVTLYADSRKWLQEGWIDYLAPQVYWYIGQPGANYSLIVPWWNNNAYGRHIYIGMAGYKVNDPIQGGVNWAIPTMIPNEVRINRSPANANVYGQAIYNTSSLLATNKLGFRDSLRLNFYKHPALQPRMPWRDNVAPEAPIDVVAVQYGGDSVLLNWKAPTYVSNEFDQVKRFVIYRSKTAAINFNDGSNIIAITPTPITTFKDKSLPENRTYYYAVTSLDRFHNESTPSNVTDYLPPVIACAPTQELFMNEVCEITMPDFTGLAVASDDVTASADILITQSPVAGTMVSNPGNYEITITASDASGKSSACTFIAVLKDVTAPTILTAPENITVATNEAATDCFVNVSWEEPTAKDNCDNPIDYFTRTHAPGDAFPVGKTTVTYVFKDQADNEKIISFNVHVQDHTKPSVVTKNINRDLVDGVVNITTEDVDAGTFDNCGILSMVISPSTFTCEDIGTVTVTLTATDVHGNENSATAQVSINGTIPHPLIAVTRDDQTHTGLPANTIAIGYGAQSLGLSVTNPIAGESYEWSPAIDISQLSGATAIFQPSYDGTYNYNVTVLNQYGCVGQGEVQLEVIDVRCGNKSDKVAMCRIVDGQLITTCVAPQAVPAQLKIGGWLGCENSSSTSDTFNANALSAYPNPFDNYLTVEFQLSSSEKYVQVDLLDRFGVRVMDIFRGSVESGAHQAFTLDPSTLVGQMFYVRMTTSSGKNYYTKLVKQ